MICAVLIAAPTPVITPQPISEATSSGTSSSTLMTECSSMMISSVNVPQPAKPPMGFPSSRKCGLAPIPTPEQSCGWPRRHCTHFLQAGVNEMMTWSPGSTSVTP